MPFAEDPLGQHSGGGGAIAGDVVGLAGGFLDELGTKIFVGVVQFDVLGDGHAVLGHLGRTPPFVEHGIAAAGAEGAANCPGEFLDTGCSGLRASSSNSISLATVYSSCVIDGQGSR